MLKSDSVQYAPTSLFNAITVIFTLISFSLPIQFVINIMQDLSYIWAAVSAFLSNRSCWWCCTCCCCCCCCCCWSSTCDAGCKTTCIQSGVLCGPSIHWSSFLVKSTPHCIMHMQCICLLKISEGKNILIPWQMEAKKFCNGLHPTRQSSCRFFGIIRLVRYLFWN